MVSRSRPVLSLILACALAAFAGAAVAQTQCPTSCDAVVVGCSVVHYSHQTQWCCKDLDGDEVKHCIQCWRDLYLCPQAIYRLGPGYDCFGNPGSVCQ